jgi:hypothetical protein
LPTSNSNQWKEPVLTEPLQRRCRSRNCKKRKIEPEKISAPAVAIRSAIAAAMSKSNRRSAIIWKKDRLDKSIGLVTGNQ